MNRDLLVKYIRENTTIASQSISKQELTDHFSYLNSEQIARALRNLLDQGLIRLTASGKSVVYLGGIQ